MPIVSTGSWTRPGIDVLLATSKHNVQYLLGGYRSFFFDYMDAIGVSRYLPVFVYPKGKPDRAAYHRPSARDTIRRSSSSSGTGSANTVIGTVDAMKQGDRHICASSAREARRIGVEMSLPAG